MTKPVTPDQQEQFVRLRQQGWAREPAAKMVGVSARWAYEFERQSREAKA